MLARLNDAEVEAVAGFYPAHGLTLPRIATPPVGETGRAASGRYVDLQRLRARPYQRKS